MLGKTGALAHPPGAVHDPDCALVVIVLVAALLLYATTRPDSFRVERSISIQAPPEKVFALINDFHRFGAWSPWEHLDPKMQRSFSGPDRGKGAVYAWHGNEEVGAGRMEIMDAVPPSKVLIKLDFLQPFESHNTSEYTLRAQGDSTAVTWAMYGPSPYITKLMGIFSSMDSMLGKDFEKGLAQMKAQTEK